MEKIKRLLLLILVFSFMLVACSNDTVETEELNQTLTYSNLVDKGSQEEVRETMNLAGIGNENIELFFENINNFNSTIEETSLVEKDFITIDSFEADYDLIRIMELLDAKSPDFIGYNCRMTTYDLMKDSMEIGKIDSSNSSWLVFDENAIENNPKNPFSQTEYEEFLTLYSFILTESSKDIALHLEKVQEDWEIKEIEFPDKDKMSIISVVFHDEEDGYLFVGHTGLLLPSQEGKLLFIEKLSFQEPYQAIKFDNRRELNDYLMNKYDISWDQLAARPFIMENNQLLEGYRENINNPEIK